MRFIYIVTIAAGCAYIGHRFHWPNGVMAAAALMTIVFAFYISRVIDEDRHE